MSEYTGPLYSTTFIEITDDNDIIMHCCLECRALIRHKAYDLSEHTAWHIVKHNKEAELISQIEKLSNWRVDLEKALELMHSKNYQWKYMQEERNKSY